MKWISARKWQERKSGLTHIAHTDYNKVAFILNIIKMADMQGYCVKCKAKRSFADGWKEVAFGKKGRRAVKGNCSKCKTGMYKILPTKK
jgi:hypothetical protein